MGRWGCSTVIKIARGRRIEIDVIIFVAQRRLEDQHFVFDAAATGEPKVLSDTALAALWLRGSPRILPDSTLPSSVSARQHGTIAALPQPERDEMGPSPTKGLPPWAFGPDCQTTASTF